VSYERYNLICVTCNWPSCYFFLLCLPGNTSGAHV
jgi:hypothetical protein